MIQGRMSDKRLFVVHPVVGFHPDCFQDIVDHFRYHEESFSLTYRELCRQEQIAESPHLYSFQGVKVFSPTIVISLSLILLYDQSVNDHRRRRNPNLPPLVTRGLVRK